mgnify:CR=1 FL=1
MTLRLYNTLTRKVEPFISVHGNKVYMYVCGPTVYDYCHIGHARSYLTFDVLKRYLQFLGYTVIHVQNFTDVDDRILQKASETGVEPQKVSEKYITAYFDDMDKLGIQRANIYTKVTEHIDEIIDAIAKLIEKNFAYESAGDVYFSVKKSDRFGVLSHQKIEDMLVGARIEVSENKRNAMDFALWKKKKENEKLGWASPWSIGRPGWHIECSVMSMKYLGETLDIHGGGLDLIFPHHESEILQSEALTGKQFVRFWIHNGFVNINKEKMSKSLGNIFTLHEAFQHWSPEVIRFFLLYTHYRSTLDFTVESINESAAAYHDLYSTVSKIYLLPEKFLVSRMTEYERNVLERFSNLAHEFFDVLDDDLNTREAIARLFKISSLLNEYLNSAGGTFSRELINTLRTFFRDVHRILGIFPEKSVASEKVVQELVELLLELRQDYRVRKEFDKADKIREILKKNGIIIEDAGNVTIWH